jgi:hypothetical protein
MTKTNYSEMLKGELLAVARRLGLTNLSRLRKDEIIDLIKRASRRKATSAEQPTAKATKKTTKKATTKKATTKKTAKKAATKAATKPAAADRTGKKATTTATKKTTKKAAVKTTKKTTPAKTKRARSFKASEAAAPGPVSAQADAVASKYGAATEYRPEELQGVDEGLAELPDNYGDNRIVLLPRDPAWLFAYWNLTYEYKEAARAAGGRVLALRVYDVTELDFDGTNANAAFEHECAEWARSWYLPVPAPDRDYIVEIGYRGGDEWYPLARSRRVSVPADQPSTLIKNDFATIGFDEDLGAVRDRLPREPSAEAVPVTPQTIFDDGELRIVVGGPFFNPSGVPSWPLFSQAVLAAELPGSVSHIPGSLGQLPGSLGQLPGSLGQLPGSLGQLPGSLGQLPGSLGQLPGSLGQVSGSLGQLSQLTRHPGTPRGDGGLGTELDAMVFGGQPVVLEDQAQPMLQAAVEMVVSGRSFPGTAISIAGQSIPTGPDGAFSLRVSVPEGIRDLPIEARSLESGVTRRLVLRFGREFEPSLSAGDAEP